MKHDFVIGRIAKVKCAVDINEDTGVLVVTQEGVLKPLVVHEWNVAALDADATAKARPRNVTPEDKAARDREIQESIEARRKEKKAKAKKAEKE